MRTMPSGRRTLTAACLVLLLASELPAAYGRASVPGDGASIVGRVATTRMFSPAGLVTTGRANSVRTELAHHATIEPASSAAVWGAGRRWGLCIGWMAATSLVAAIGTASAGPVGGAVAFGALFPLVLEACS